MTPATSPLIDRAVDAIRRAPSGHNAQPWRLRIDDSTIHLGWDRQRNLEAADPGASYACFALGCAIESALQVPGTTYEPGDERAPLESEWFAGLLRLEGDGDEPLTAGEMLLRKRATNRGPYRSEAPEGRALRELTATAEAYGCDLVAWTEARDIAGVARITREAARIDLSSAEFLEELLGWIRLSDAEGALHGDGFTPRTLDLPAALVPALKVMKRSARARRLATSAGLAAAMARDTQRLLRRSGALLLLTNPSSSPHARIASGQALLALWLAATERELALQPVNFAVHVDGTRRELLDRAGLPSTADAVALLRIGSARQPAPPSPRLDPRAFCTYDRAPARSTRRG